MIPFRSLMADTPGNRTVPLFWYPRNDGSFTASRDHPGRYESDAPFAGPPIRPPQELTASRSARSRASPLRSMGLASPGPRLYPAPLPCRPVHRPAALTLRRPDGSTRLTGLFST